MKNVIKIVTVLFLISLTTNSYSYNQYPGKPEAEIKNMASSPPNVVKSSAVKAIIFDIGNVFVSVELNLWPKSFQKIGISLPEDILRNKEMRDLIHTYNEGRIPTAHFIKQICKEMKVREIPIQEFEVAWNFVILSVFEESINILRDLHAEGYQVFALSDTNEMHAEYIERLYQKLHPNKSFYKLFDKSYLSHLTGYRKSKDEAWIQILKEQKLNPEECLFVDDLLENIKKAEKIGMHVFLYTPDSNMNLVRKKIEEINNVSLNNG